MIIYGSKAKQLAIKPLAEACPNCGTPDSLVLHVFQKYAHVFWLPFFPMQKMGVSQCVNCKQVLKNNEMPYEVAVHYHSMKKAAKTPIWLFSGLALIGVLVISNVYSESVKSSDSKKYIQHLAPKDLVEIKTDDGHYTYLMVSATSGDSIFLHPNKQEALFQTGLDKLSTSESGFSEETLLSTQQKMAEMFEKGTILNVVRR